MIEIDPKEVAPSQDFLKEKTVQFILQCVLNNEEDQLPPIPIVRRDEQGKLVAIDGHNLLAVKVFLGRKQEVHVAESAEDGLPTDSEAHMVRNQDLHDKFDSSLSKRKAVNAEGVNTFDDLITRYPELFEKTE